MFSYCRPEDAAAEHQRLLDWEKQMLAKIEVPYRVIDTAAGDLGGPAARKFDCEAWVPTQGRYRELTSTSNCTTYQARRLDIREREPERLGHPARRHPQRHPGAPPAGSSPSSRTTSRPTARSSCRRRCGRTSGLDVLTPRAERAMAERLVALDVDGTTLRHDGTLSTAVRDAVREVADAGVHVVIATGARSSRRCPIIDGARAEPRLRRLLQRRRHDASSTRPSRGATSCSRR